MLNRISSILCQTRAKSGPFFQVLALVKSFPLLTFMIQLYSNHYQERCILFYSYKSCKQLSLKQDNSSYIKQVELIKLLRDDCHKQVVTHIRESRWFESMYTLQGKTRPTRHTHLTLSPHMVLDHTYLTRSMHSNLSWDADRFGRILLLLRKRAPDTIHSMLADRSAGP
jgi:hypothetical protein